MIILLLIFGLFTGFVAGFFGVGGGMILIPMLLLAKYNMKEAVSISIIQMVFSSSYGTFLNYKSNKTLLKDGLSLGFGGFLGGFLSGFIVVNINEIYLKYIFLFIVIAAIIRVYTTPQESNKTIIKHSIFSLSFIGFIIGTIAMSIGVGGAVMLTPILVGYMYYNLKDASSLGLFFVIFSSIAGLFSSILHHNFYFYDGVMVGLGSLFGVYIGIKIKNLVHIGSYKIYILILYIFILFLTLYKLYF